MIITSYSISILYLPENSLCFWVGDAMFWGNKGAIQKTLENYINKKYQVVMHSKPIEKEQKTPYRPG